VKKLTWQHEISDPPNGTLTTVQMSKLIFPFSPIPAKRSSPVFVWISTIVVALQKCKNKKKEIISANFAIAAISSLTDRFK
jgi:hypothetical protein